MRAGVVVRTERACGAPGRRPRPPFPTPTTKCPCETPELVVGTRQYRYTFLIVFDGGGGAPVSIPNRLGFRAVVVEPATGGVGGY